jgi:hypothetical protein
LERERPSLILLGRKPALEPFKIFAMPRLVEESLISPVSVIYCAARLEDPKTAPLLSAKPPVLRKKTAESFDRLPALGAPMNRSEKA